MLKEKGLVLGQVQEESSYTVEQGKVTQQWPVEAGTDVNPGDKITIFISTGTLLEALQYPFNINVSPKEVGKNSKIRITFEDARGKNQWGSRTINSAQVLTIPLVLAPNENGAVSVYRDGKFLDTYVVSYSEAKNGTVNVPSIDPEQNTQAHLRTILIRGTVKMAVWITVSKVSLILHQQMEKGIIRKATLRQ